MDVIEEVIFASLEFIVNNDHCNYGANYKVEIGESQKMRRLFTHIAGPFDSTPLAGNR